MPRLAPPILTEERRTEVISQRSHQSPPPSGKPYYTSTKSGSISYMDPAKWATREGEDVLYIGLIGAGGCGEIHEVSPCVFIVGN